MKFFIISVIVISIIGTISHFIYDLTNHNKIVGIFTSVNESVWEHIKLAITPTILWSLVDGFIYGSNPNYFFAKFVSLLIIIVLMPILFYGYKNILKKDIPIFNILIFYIVVISSQYVFFIILRLDEVDFLVKYLSCIGLFILIGGYLIHTLYPAKNVLFKDPITKKYGYDAHK